MEPPEERDDVAIRRSLEALVGARFSVLEKIGAGRFGAIFAAFDEDHRRPVAIKTLARLGEAAETALRRTIAELSRTRSPNVVALYELLVGEGGAALVMERLVGVDLMPHIRSDAQAASATHRPTLPLAFGQPVQDGGRSAFAPCTPSGILRLRSVLGQAARGVGTLHSIGLVHRDLHPGNILVESSGRAVVLDLGLALEVRASRGDDDEIAGTAAYMAPEQASGEPVDTACDIYALGVLLFEALTGALPFNGSAQEVMVRKQTVSAPSPSFVLGGVTSGAPDPTPPDLDALCVRMLRRDPRSRPSAVEVAGALGADVHAAPR